MSFAALRTATALLAMFVVAPAFADERPADHHFREALFHAHLGDPFEALARLDTELALHQEVDERPLDLLHRDLPQAEFSVGDFELRYRMHQRAGRAMTAVIEGDVSPSVRADAIVRLARLHHQKGAPVLALETLDRLDEPVPEAVRDAAYFVRASALMAVGRFEEAAVALRDLGDDERLAAFADYNLAIALLGADEPVQAGRQLDRAGRRRARDRESEAIRDKANLLLGTILFEAGEFERAGDVLDRVRLEGIHSNEALLRAGWSAASASRFERAVVPWSLLADRDPTDPAVQEALLALPYAYGEIEIHGRAAQLYERAAGTFGGELEKVDASLRSIESGAFLRMLDDERIRRDRDWVVRMREMPDMPETFYLVALMASHDFQTGLQNYLDLSDMRRHLVEGQRSLEAFADLVDRRRAYYEPRLPAIDHAFRALDARRRLRVEQRDLVAESLERMLTSPAPHLLATAEELAAIERLESLRSRIGDGADAAGLARRLDRLQGLVTWNLETRYHDRLAEVHAALEALSHDVDEMQRRYARFVRVRQAAQHGHSGFDATIVELARRAERAIERIDGVREAQGRALEAVARRELVSRRARLAEYQNKARFAFADSYDRAVHKQAIETREGAGQ